jgi:predicted nucleic acid-binding protein
MAEQLSTDPVSPGCVIDASVTMPWFFPDEATPFTEGLLDALGAQVFWAPTLWVLECTNVLQSAQRRKRIATPAAGQR